MSLTSLSRQPRPIDVLVVGAGPAGLTAALEARRLGMSVRIVERHRARVHRSKALVVHARTMEVFDTLELSESLRSRGEVFRALNLHGCGGAAGRIDLGALDWGDTQHPFWLTVPQYETEQVLERALRDAGVAIEWGTTFTSAQQTPAVVTAHLHDQDGAFDVQTRWLVGADGGRSAVRETIGGHMRREDARATFVLADAFTTCDLPEDEGHFHLHPEGLLIIVPMPTPRQWRIIAHMPEQGADDPTPIDAAMLDALIARRAAVRFGAHDVGWTSRFALSHGVSDRTRDGRVFLIGDAAHVHSPVGGQGLNTGVQDAHGLMWRLAVADRLDDAARDALLDSFAAERGQVAEQMVNAVRRATTLVTGRSSLARRVFGAVAPRVLPRTRAREILARPIAGLQVRYGDGALMTSNGGARPANRAAVGGGRVLDRLAFGAWSWIVRDASANGPWQNMTVIRTADGDGPRVQLVRPDGYVAASGDDLVEVWHAVAAHPTLAAAVAAAGE